MTMFVAKGDSNDNQEVPNPAYIQWKAQEQQVLSYFLTSFSREVLTQVVAMTTPAEVWRSIEGFFSSQSRARVINTRMALATTQKSGMSVTEYIGKMKTLADEMAYAGKKLEDEELVSYILAGLNVDYNPLMLALAARVEPISVGELYAQMLSFEMRMDLLQGGPNSSANSATRGGHGGRDGCGRGRGCGNGRGHGCDGSNGGFNNNSSSNKPTCQLCGKVGHTIIKCYRRFDPTFTGEEKSAGSATTSYGIDTNWYTDMGAIHHITSELDKLTVRDKYTGNDQVHTASGAGSGNEENSSSWQV